MSFFEELKRRNVFRVGIAYLIVAWLTLQVTDIVVPILELPDVFDRGVLLLLAIGFPFALIFAWAFEMTPEGVKKEKDVDRAVSITQHTGRKLPTTHSGGAHLLIERPTGGVKPWPLSLHSRAGDAQLRQIPAPPPA